LPVVAEDAAPEVAKIGTMLRAMKSTSNAKKNGGFRRKTNYNSSVKSPSFENDFKDFRENFCCEEQMQFKFEIVALS
jgi:hypothetical protein